MAIAARGLLKEQPAQPMLSGPCGGRVGGSRSPQCATLVPRAGSDLRRAAPTKTHTHTCVHTCTHTPCPLLASPSLLLPFHLPPWAQVPLTPVPQPASPAPLGQAQGRRPPPARSPRQWRGLGRRCPSAPWGPHLAWASWTWAVGRSSGLRCGRPRPTRRLCKGEWVPPPTLAHGWGRLWLMCACGGGGHAGMVG